MTVEQRLEVHLLSIVMPLDVPLDAREQLALCAKATRAQRQAAFDRAMTRNPLLLPDEMEAGRKWVEG